MHSTTSTTASSSPTSLPPDSPTTPTTDTPTAYPTTIELYYPSDPTPTHTYADTGAYTTSDLRRPSLASSSKIVIPSYRCHNYDFNTLLYDDNCITFLYQRHHILFVRYSTTTSDTLGTSLGQVYTGSYTGTGNRQHDSSSSIQYNNSTSIVHMSTGTRSTNKGSCTSSTPRDLNPYDNIIAYTDVYTTNNSYDTINTVPIYDPSQYTILHKTPPLSLPISHISTPLNIPESFISHTEVLGKIVSVNDVVISDLDIHIQHMILTSAVQSHQRPIKLLIQIDQSTTGHNYDSHDLVPDMADHQLPSTTTASTSDVIMTYSDGEGVVDLNEIVSFDDMCPSDKHNLPATTTTAATTNTSTAAAAVDQQPHAPSSSLHTHTVNKGSDNNDMKSSSSNTLNTITGSTSGVDISTVTTDDIYNKPSTTTTSTTLPTTTTIPNAASIKEHMTYTDFLSLYNHRNCAYIRKKVSSVLTAYTTCDWVKAVVNNQGKPQTTLLSLYNYIEVEMDKMNMFDLYKPLSAREVVKSSWTNFWSSPTTTATTSNSAKNSTNNNNSDVMTRKATENASNVLYLSDLRQHIETMLFTQVYDYTMSFLPPILNHLNTTSNTTSLSKNQHPLTSEGVDDVTKSKGTRDDSCVLDSEVTSSLAFKVASLRHLITLPHLGLSPHPSSSSHTTLPTPTHLPTLPTSADQQNTTTANAPSSSSYNRELSPEWSVAVTVLQEALSQRSPGEVLGRLVRFNRLLVNLIRSYLYHNRSPYRTQTQSYTPTNPIQSQTQSQSQSLGGPVEVAEHVKGKVLIYGRTHDMLITGCNNESGIIAYRHLTPHTTSHTPHTTSHVQESKHESDDIIDIFFTNIPHNSDPSHPSDLSPTYTTDEISADDLLPALIWILIQGYIPYIDSIIYICQEFRHPELCHGEESYCLSQLSSAVEFIRGCNCYSNNNNSDSNCNTARGNNTHDNNTITTHSTNTNTTVTSSNNTLSSNNNNIVKRSSSNDSYTSNKSKNNNSFESLSYDTYSTWQNKFINTQNMLYTLQLYCNSSNNSTTTTNTNHNSDLYTYNNSTSNIENILETLEDPNKLQTIDINTYTIDYTYTLLTLCIRYNKQAIFDELISQSSLNVNQCILPYPTITTTTPTTTPSAATASTMPTAVSGTSPVTDAAVCHVPPLILAVQYNRIRMLISLLHRKADRYISDSAGNTALSLATYQKNVSARRLLAVDPLLCQNQFITLIQYKDIYTIISSLLQRVSINMLYYSYSTQYWTTPLIATIYSNDIYMLKVLLCTVISLHLPFYPSTPARSEEGKCMHTNDEGKTPLIKCVELVINAYETKDIVTMKSLIIMTIMLLRAETFATRESMTQRKSDWMAAETVFKVFIGQLFKSGGEGGGEGARPKNGACHIQLPSALSSEELNRMFLLSLEQPDYITAGGKSTVNDDDKSHGFDSLHNSPDFYLHLYHYLLLYRSVDPPLTLVQLAESNDIYGIWCSLVLCDYNINETCYERGFSPLIAAVYHNNMITVELLLHAHDLARIGDFTIPSYFGPIPSYGNTTTTSSATTATSPILTDTLQSNTIIAVVDAQGAEEEEGQVYEGETLEDIYPLLELPLPAPVDVNLTDAHNRTALHYATQHGNHILICRLLALKIDRYIVDIHGYAALDIAYICHPHAYDLHSILRYDPGVIPMNLAAKGDDWEVIKALLYQGVSLNQHFYPTSEAAITSITSLSSTHLAPTTSSKALKSADSSDAVSGVAGSESGDRGGGGDDNGKINEGKGKAADDDADAWEICVSLSPLTIAVIYQHYTLIETLLKLLPVNMMDINFKSLLGRTALMYASLQLDEKVVLLLLKHGANRGIKDDYGLTTEALLSLPLSRHQQQLPQIILNKLRLTRPQPILPYPTTDLARLTDLSTPKQDILNILKTVPGEYRIHDVIYYGDYDRMVALIKQGVSAVEPIYSNSMPQSTSTNATTNTATTVATTGAVTAAGSKNGSPTRYNTDTDDIFQLGAFAAAIGISSPRQSPSHGGSSKNRHTIHYVNGITPLMIAALGGSQNWNNTKIMTYLLSLPEVIRVINVTDDELGWTALFHAANMNQDEAVLVLLKYGADRNILDKHGTTTIIITTLQ